MQRIPCKIYRHITLIVEQSFKTSPKHTKPEVTLCLALAASSSRNELRINFHGFADSAESQLRAQNG
jgi:hypothetical protein